jgi:diguanylate cyclase (GGDEF)-like protein
MRLIDHSLGPLRKVTIAAQNVASGKLDSRVRVSTGDEFEQLGDAFNYMADRIGHQIAALEAMSGIDRLILTGTKLEKVSQDVVEHLIGLSNCESAAVIARDTDSPNVGTMISSHNGEMYQERIELPDNAGPRWRQPQQLDLADMDTASVPFSGRFLSFGQTHIALVPVMLNDKLKGLLLLGFDRRFDMSHSSLSRCVDLAGRFAVALSSVEREEALYQQAHFDVLTGLPNRQLLKDRLNQNLANARLDKHHGAILFLDLDRFKEINDVFGHSVGDNVLVQTSERIKTVVREQDTVARLGGDEFVVVLANVRNDSIVRSTAERLLDKLGEAFTVAGTDHYLSASIGITMFPDDGATVESLLKNSDAAMYKAKDAGRGRFEFFSKRLNAESRRKIGIERDLRVATQRGDLELYYQPQIDISTGSISGAEALLRWTHPVHGAISPAEFIPLAEDSDLIVEIGSWVIEEACVNLAALLEMGFHPGPMSINVSGRQLADTRFTQAVMEPIRRHNIHPGYIQLEVTETVVAQNRDRAISILKSLRSEGVRVAIDDFGTGYSSLSYLQQMPFDVIKIDKSFIDEIGTSEASDNICRTIIKMAEQLGKKSIAEGVEQREQLEFLRENGCDFIQGFFYAKPLPSAEFLEYVQKQDFHTQRRKALEIF